MFYWSVIQGNIYIIVCILKNKKLQNVFGFHILSIAFIEVLYNILVRPVFIFQFESDKKVLLKMSSNKKSKY